MNDGINSGRYRVWSDEYVGGIVYTVVDTETPIPPEQVTLSPYKVVRDCGGDFDEAWEFAREFNRNGYWRDPLQDTIWDLREG